MMTWMALCVMSVLVSVPFPVHGETTFTNSTVESVDADARQVTIRAADGRSWSLPVERVELLKGLQKGDRVSLEIGPDDQVKKIVKAQPGESQKPTTNEPSD